MVDSLIQKASQLRFPSLEDYIRLAQEALRGTTYERQPWLGADHGVRIYTNERELNCYLAAYGQIHQAKLEFVFDKFVASIGQMPSVVNIIDWGCGQGLATLCFIEYCHKRHIACSIVHITLIEVSTVAIQRATALIRLCQPLGNPEISPLSGTFESLGKQVLVADDQRPTLNLFSNILDVETINIKCLTKFYQQANRALSYALCVGPRNNRERIDSFCDQLVDRQDLAREQTTATRYVRVPIDNNRDKSWPIYCRLFVTGRFVTAQSPLSVSAMPLVLTNCQQNALNAINRFLDGPGSIFILRGYAGTGKTSLIRSVLEKLDHDDRVAFLCAPTGRAAKILQQRTHCMASTIHHLIYGAPSLESKGDAHNKNDEGSPRLVFPLRHQDFDDEYADRPPVVIVDEASMVGNRDSSDEQLKFGSGCLLNDLLEYADLGHGGKIVFVGDPAQLAPVGEPESQAFNEDFFRQKGLVVQEALLDQIVRQRGGGAILDNATKFRDLISKDVSLRMISEFDFVPSEFESSPISVDEVAQRYVVLYPVISLDSGVIITYSNQSAVEYNVAVRRCLFPGMLDLTVGDRLLVVKNRYKDSQSVILNGEFAKVLRIVSLPEVHKSFYWHKGEADKPERVPLELRFRDVELSFDDMSRMPAISLKIVENSLLNGQTALSDEESIALEMDFRMRHEDDLPELAKGDDPAEREAKRRRIRAIRVQDPYLNALQVKFGYAVTGHKAQGGEWNTVFVDYRGRVGFDDDRLRWCYTATTRASKTVYAIGLSANTMEPTNLIEFQQGIMKKCRPAKDAFAFVAPPVSATPYHSPSDGVLVGVRIKYIEVCDRLRGTEFSIVDVRRCPFKDIYTFKYVKGQQIVADTQYDDSGYCRPFSCRDKDSVSISLLELLNRPCRVQCHYEYKPETEQLKLLDAKVKRACLECGIAITNVLSEVAQYRVTYYLQTSANFAEIKFFYKRKGGRFTTAQSWSELGDDDVLLKKLIIRLEGR